MIQASHVSMGFLRSLYYEQIQKSIADAKEKRAHEVEEEAKQSRQRELTMRRNITEARKRGRHIRPVEATNNQNNRRPIQSRIPAPPTNISAEDFVDALEEME